MDPEHLSEIFLHSQSDGATENAEVENAIRSKMQGWKMQEWKMLDMIAGVKNAGVGEPYGKPNRHYNTLKDPKVTSKNRTQISE